MSDCSSRWNESLEHLVSSMRLITGDHVSCTIDDCKGQTLVLHPPAHQRVSIVAERSFRFGFLPANLPDVLLSLNIRHNSISVTWVKQDLHTIGFKFLEKGDWFRFFMIVLSNIIIATEPLNTGIHMQLLLYSLLIIISLDSLVISARGTSRSHSHDRIVLFEERSIIESPPSNSETFRSIAQSDGGIRININDTLNSGKKYLITQLISLDASGVEIIRIFILTVLDEFFSLCSIEVVFWIKLVPSFSSPVLVGDHHSVADHHSLEVDLGSQLHVDVGIDESRGEVRDIHSTVRFASNPEIVILEVIKSFEPSFDGEHIIWGCSAFIIDITFILVHWESDSRRWLNEKQICIVIPGVWVEMICEEFWTWEEHVWPHLLGEAQQTGTARSAIKPKHNIIIVFVDFVHCGDKEIVCVDERLFLEGEETTEHPELACEVNIPLQLFDFVVECLLAPGCLGDEEKRCEKKQLCNLFSHLYIISITQQVLHNNWIYYVQFLDNVKHIL